MPGTVLANPNDAAPESLSSITPTKSKAIASTLGQAASCEGHSEPPPVDPSTTLRVGKTCSFPRCGDRDCAALCHPTPAKQSVPSAASSFGTPESEQHASQPQMLGDACDTAVAHFGKLSMGLVLPLSTTSASDGASVAESGEGAFVGHTEYCIVVDGVEDAAKIEETKCFSSNNPCAVDLRGKSSVAQSSDVFRESQPSTASTHDSQSNPLKVAITVNRNTESLSDVSPSTSPTTATGVSHNGSSNHLSISVENARMRYDIRRRRARPALSQSFGSLLLGPTTPNVGSTILRSPGSEFPLGGTVSSPATSQVCVGSSAGVSVYPSSPGMSGAFSTGGVSCYMEVLEPLTTLCPHFPERLRIPMSRLRVTLGNQHELGKGQYGVVVQGELYPPGTDVRARKCTSPPPPPPLSDNLSARSSSSVAMYASGGSSHIRPPAASLPPCPIANDVDGVLADLPLHQQPFSAMTASFYNGGVELMSAHSSFFQTAATSSAIVSTPREDKSAASENAQLPSHLDPASVVVRRDAADDAASLPVAKGFQTAGIPSVYDSAERTMSPHSPMWTPRFQLPRPSATVSERCPQHGVELGSTSSCDIPNESESWSSQKLPADEATVAAPLSHVPHPASLCTCSLSASRCSPPPPNQNDVEDDDLDVYGSDVGLNSRAMSNSFRSTEYPSPVYSPGMQSRLRSGDLTPLPGLHLPSHPASIREDDIPPALTPQVDSDFVTPDRPRNRPFYVNVLDFHPMRREVCDALPAKVVDGQIKETSQGSTPLPSVQIASESLSFHTSSNMEDQLGDPVVPPQLTMKSLLTEGSRTKNRCGVAERLRTNCANHKLYNASSASTNTPVETAEVVEHLRLSNLRHGPSTEGDGTAAESVSDSHLRYDQVTQSHECSIPYRHVAVKMYAKTNLSSTNKLREGLCNEVLMASRLSHPCIAHVYGVSEDQEHVYLIIDLADHGTLGEYLQKFGVAHTREMAPRLLADVVLALEYLRDSSAHPFVPQVENQNGPAPAAANVPVADDVLVSPPAWVQDGVVQHKDLKPQNLLLTWDYHVKLSDFGSACFLGDTTANRYGGSIAYLSPEVMLNSKAGPCSDLWALGCILCELMQGEPPFYGETEYRLMAAIQNYAKGKTQLILSDEIPQVARDLIQELLQPVPSKRLGSMERGGFSSLKKHPFFAAIDWDRVLEVNNVTSTNTNFTAELSEYLMEQECAVFCATVSLPPGRRDIALLGTPFEMVSSEQILLLVLTNSPRMFLLNPAVKQTPSEGTTMITFPWVPELSVEVLDRPDHVCITSTAAFGPLYLRDLSQSATQWAAHVELVKSQTVGTKPTVEGLVAAQSMSFSSNSCVLNSLREAVSSSSPQPNPPLGTNSASNYLSSTGTLVSIPSGREKRRPSNSSDALFLRRLRGTAPALRQSPSRMSASARQRGSPATSGCTTPVRSTHCRSAPPDMKSPTPNPCIASPDGESCGALMKRSTSSTFCCSPGTTAAFVNGDSLAASSMLSANARSAITRGVMSPVEGDASIFSGFVLPQPVHNSGNNSSSVTPFSIDFGRTHDESSIAGRQSAERVPDLGRGSTCGGLEDVL